MTCFAIRRSRAAPEASGTDSMLLNRLLREQVVPALARDDDIELCVRLVGPVRIMNVHMSATTGEE
jgi:hypothetical protein